MDQNQDQDQGQDLDPDLHQIKKADQDRHQTRKVDRDHLQIKGAEVHLIRRVGHQDLRPIKEVDQGPHLRAGAEGVPAPAVPILS